jgi:hypothetical protein
VQPGLQSSAAEWNHDNSNVLRVLRPQPAASARELSGFSWAESEQELFGERTRRHATARVSNDLHWRARCISNVYANPLQTKQRVSVMLTAIAIFVATYAFLAIGEIPGLRIDRTGAALIGAGLMVAFGVVSLPEAYRTVDFDTILLLLSMMILVAYLRLSGFFQLVSN